MDPEPPARDALHNLCLADALWSERYQGWAELGRGGSAHVVRTFSRATGEDVALKIFHHLTADDGRRFQQEVRSAQRLTSPYIVRTYSAFPRGSLAWIEMELVEGGDLRSELERCAAEGRPLALDDGLAIAQALAAALTTAHEADVVHRDVKPANVLLPRGGRPVAKLGDFGISRILGATRVTATGLMTGTPQFAAPEVAAGEAARPASDVYSLALTLFLVFSGNRFPFPVGDDASAAQWLRTHREAAAWPLRRLSPDAPEALEKLVADGLAKDPADRPSASEMLDRLAALLANTATLGAPRRHPARRPRRLAAAVALGSTLAAAGLYGTFRAGQAAPTAAPSASPTPAAVPSAPPSSLSASLLPDAVAILNAGPEAVRDLQVVLTGDGPGTYTAAAPGPLAPGEEIVLALEGFHPAPPPGWRPRRVEVTPAGGGVQQVELP
jgi:eukaryotic-like serine/threonine-protein kinase